MSPQPNADRVVGEVARPWYREPWPWVLIAIPALTVVACGITLWLALRYPETVVLDMESYQQIRAELRAQSQPAGPAAVEEAGPAHRDGDR